MFVREHTRYPVELAVRMKCSTWGDYVELHTTNLSRGGLFVPSPISAPIGTELAIELTLPNATMVKLRGEVVHMTEAAGEQVAGIGVMFFGVDGDATRALEDALKLAKANTARPLPPMKPVPPSAKAAPPVAPKAVAPAPAKVAAPVPPRAAAPVPPRADARVPLVVAKAAPPAPPRAVPPPIPVKPAPVAAKPAPAPVATKPTPAPVAAKPTPAPVAAAPSPLPLPLPLPLPPAPTAEGWDAPPAAAPDARAPRFADAVEQALLDELARRLDLQPQDQLGLAPNAGDEEIAEAHRRLKERYAPTIFARYGTSTAAVIKSINDVIDAAHTKLQDPNERRALVIAAHQPRASELSPTELEQKRRGEEARAALRAGIERRVGEACAHRDMQRLDEAIRGFEHVLELDRKHEFARAELAKLRDLKAKRKR